MTQPIEKRESFLNHLAEQLGQERHSLPEADFVSSSNLSMETLSDKSVDELLDIAKEKCKTIHTKVVEVTASNLESKLEELIQTYGNGRVLFPTDERFSQYELNSLVSGEGKDFEGQQWLVGAENREENIDRAAEANVAIAFAENLLAESGTVVVESHPGQGRSLHFLPQNYISIIPKSQIVPRSTQAAMAFKAKQKAGEKTGSALHFISGPSNSGDIEMQLVVGVHGPIDVVYVVVTDK